MVKDPWWLYAYWEIQPVQERQVRSQLAPDEHAGLQTVLRVYDVTDLDFPNQPAHRFFDIPLSGLATSWFIHADAPNRSFVIDLGLLTVRGRFLTIVRSNRVTTPRFGPSEVIDEQWMVADEEYWRLLGVTTGIGMGSSPSGLRALLERKLHSAALSSPGLFSPTRPKPGKERGFWLWVDAELIIYGATDPKAAVSIQGQPIRLRPDGTFSVRMALPDGALTIPVEAVSPDRQEAQTITPTVTRTTEGRKQDRSNAQAGERSGIS